MYICTYIKLKQKEKKSADRISIDNCRIKATCVYVRASLMLSEPNDIYNVMRNKQGSLKYSMQKTC